MKTLLITLLYEINPLGPMNVACYLKDNGQDVKELFVPLNQLEEVFWTEKDTVINDHYVSEIVKLISQEKPKLIGISLYTIHYYSAIKITEAIKKEFPEILVIWGGIHPTIAPEESIQHADILCRGDGEAPMLELAQCLEKGESIENIKSLWVKKGDQVIRNEIRHLIEDLDSLGFTRFDWENIFVLHKGRMHSLSKDIYQKCVPRNGRIYDIMATRGCPYSCAYCCNSVFKELYAGKGKLIRNRSISSVIEEIEYAINEFEFVDMINFQDDVFIRRTKDGWLQNFIKEYKEKIGYPFICKGSPREVVDETISMLSDAGLEYFQIGIQNSDRVNREVYNRNTSSRDQIIRASEILTKYEVVGRYDIILDDPFATEEDLLEVLDTLTRIKKPYVVGCFSMTFFPHSAIYTMAEEANLLSKAKSGYSLSMSKAKRTPLNNLVELAPRLPSSVVKFLMKHHKKKATHVFLKVFTSLYFRIIFITMYTLSKNSKILATAKNIRFRLNNVLSRRESEIN